MREPSARPPVSPGALSAGPAPRTTAAVTVSPTMIAISPRPMVQLSLPARRARLTDALLCRRRSGVRSCGIVSAGASGDRQLRRQVRELCELVHARRCKGFRQGGCVHVRRFEKRAAGGARESLAAAVGLSAFEYCLGPLEPEAHRHLAELLHGDRLMGLVVGVARSSIDPG